MNEHELTKLSAGQNAGHMFYETRWDIPDEFFSVKAVYHNIETHLHNCIELIYVTKGRLCFTADACAYEIHENQAMAISSYVPHSVDSTITDGEFDSFIMLIPRSCLLEYDDILNRNTFEKPFFDDPDGSVQRVFSLLYDLGGFDRPTGVDSPFAFLDSFPAQREKAIRQTISLLMNLVITKCGLKPKPRSTMPIISAIEYIGLHFREDISVSGIAKALLVNQQELSTEFRSVMGISVTEYISHLRINEAVRLLLSEQDITIESAAMRSGFGSTRSFLRDFRRDKGCTPTEFRSRTDNRLPAESIRQQQH